MLRTTELTMENPIQYLTMVHPKLPVLPGALKFLGTTRLALVLNVSEVMKVILFLLCWLEDVEAGSVALFIRRLFVLSRTTFMEFNQRHFHLFSIS